MWRLEALDPPTTFIMALRRVAIVTGAAQGIGKAIALRLARDNYHIALSDLPSKSEKLQDVRKEIVALGRRVSVVHSDVSQDGDVKMLVDAAVNDLGSVDVVRTPITSVMYP